MNKEQVLEKMEPILNAQVRRIEHRPQTKVTVTPDMVTFRPGGGQHHMDVTPPGVQSLANFVGLPWHLAAHLRPETFGHVATELLDRKNRYVLMVKDGAVTSFARSTEFHAVNPERVLRTVEGSIRGAEFHRVLILPDFAVSLEIIGEKRQPVTRGDLIQAGANVSFSPMGTVNPMVQSYTLRLVCTNGQTSNTVLREFHFGGGGDGGGGGEGDDIYQWFRRSSREAYNALDRILTQYRRMIDDAIPPEERAPMLEALLRDARITGNDANAVRALAIENPPRTRYDLMNLLTTATSHIIEAPQRIRKAQLAIAEHTSDTEHTQQCPVCHHRRN